MGQHGSPPRPRDPLASHCQGDILSAYHRAVVSHLPALPPSGVTSAIPVLPHSEEQLLTSHFASFKRSHLPLLDS